MSEDDNGDQEPFGAQHVRSLRRSQLETSAAQFNAVVNRLWAGCGGGLIAAVTAVRQPSDLFFWLSAGSFGLGVILLGFGALLTLLRERRVLLHLEDIDEVLQMKVGYAVRPSARAGLTILHPQAWTATMAAGLFVFGVLFAGIVVYRH
jgi:hypothetical protein